METIEFERTWCDYLTPCPYKNKEKDETGIMVGDYECYNCKHCKQYIDNSSILDNKGKVDYTKVVVGRVKCNFKEIE